MADPFNPPPGSVCAGNTDLFGPVFIPASAVGAPANTTVVMQAIYVRQVSGGGSYEPGDTATFPAGEAAALKALGAAV